MESVVSTLSLGEYMHPAKVTFVTLNIKTSPVFALFEDFAVSHLGGGRAGSTALTEGSAGVVCFFIVPGRDYGLIAAAFYH